MTFDTCQGLDQPWQVLIKPCSDMQNVGSLFIKFPWKSLKHGVDGDRNYIYLAFRTTCIFYNFFFGFFRYCNNMPGTSYRCREVKPLDDKFCQPFFSWHHPTVMDSEQYIFF